MEKRIGTITIFVSNCESSHQINDILSAYGQIILCRQGLPFRDRNIAVISLIVEGTSDEVNALTGRLGRLPEVTCKAIFAK
ncbi:MAG: iron-only hydrogenase system regulator [Bacteroidales bacterium]|nr:iron-only hydrogenase system regulator [Bacteroidales bacterium]